MFKKISFPIFFFLFICFYFNANTAFTQEAGIYVRTPSFVFAAGTPRYIIANDNPYSWWPYPYYPLRIRHHHHHYYYREPVYYYHRHDYGRHRGWYKHGRH